MSNCPPEVFANVMGAPLCKSCGKVWGVEDGCMCAEPALEIPKSLSAAADDFATIARRLKELEAERSKPADASMTYAGEPVVMVDGLPICMSDSLLYDPADASVSFRVADYLTDESVVWIPADGFSLQIIDLLADANEVFKNMVWTEPFCVLDADGGE